jgi:hypothetical protein
VLRLLRVQGSGGLLIAIVHFNIPSLDVWTFIARTVRAMGWEAFTHRRSYANETWNKSIVETVSPDGAQHIAVRLWRGGCSEKLDIHTRYSQRDEWIDVVFMPRKLIAQAVRERR